ncbi:hypothetical protein OPQ81_009268 [Rhizoctonia solani]|nr:hypothetical protein OPQ81_009268 [Rhizoctonia solani]
MPFECMAGAPLLRQSDKARLVIALVIARHVPNTLTPVEYVRRLRSAFPEASTGIDTESRWLERIEVLQRELECARANEARAKLELVSYQTQHPPPSSAPGIDNVPVEEPITKRSAPDSPASGSRRHPKKKRKQGGVPSMNSSSKPSSSDLELALERIHSAFDPGIYTQNIGLIATLLRLKTQTQSGQLLEDSGSISDLDYLVRRCLTDVASHMRHVCANPTAQRSLDGLNALQVVLPTILVAGIHICNAGPEFVHTLITLVLPMVHAIHPVTVAILHPATRATVPTRTRRGKPKTGVRAVRESEEVAAPDVVDIRPGLSVILSMVVRAGVGKDIMYAVLPEACKKIRELCVPVTQSRASDRRTTWTRAWAVRDSIWYLCRACHTVLQGAYLTDQDAVFVGGCTDLLVDALQLSVCTETRVSDGAARPGAQEAHNSQSALIASRTQMNDAVRDMLCALLERIMLGFPSS